MENHNTIITDFGEAWETLNPELIIKHLAENFVYNSQWVLESLDYQGYQEYIRAKFQTIRERGGQPTVTLVSDPYLGNDEKMIRLQQGNNQPAFYRIKVENGKVVKGDLCMF